MTGKRFLMNLIGKLLINEKGYNNCNPFLYNSNFSD